MILTIELTPEEETRLQTAYAAGIDVAALFKQILSLLPQTSATALDAQIQQKRDPELVARVKSVRGRFAHSKPLLASEELRRERRIDMEREDQPNAEYAS